MSLNDIQFPPIALQGLYKDLLVGSGSVETNTDKIPAQEMATLGNNQRHILILVASDETLYLPDEQLNFLLGILSACNLTMDHVSILNIKKNEGITYKTITKELKPEKLLLFGVTPVQVELPLDFPNFQIQPYNNQIYLTAPPLSHFNDNKDDKTRLWNCLKQIFEI